MKGDFTRDTFDPAKHYSRVLQQQGRVQIDADWNEQTSIILHMLRTLAIDVFGEHAGPAAKLGFEIIWGADDADLDKKLEAIEPDDTTRRDALKRALQADNMVICPGRYYVNGICVENERALLYTEQRGLPSNAATSLSKLNEPGAEALAYLDVWERHVSWVEDAHIREPALNGVDTCTREQVIWQVKMLPKNPDSKDVFDCSIVKTLPALGDSSLRARARQDNPGTGLCTVSPQSSYRGAENQLYRVEVHTGGQARSGAGGATFKWSRENGSVVFPLRSLSGTTATIELAGRDARLGLAADDWVEIVDDDMAMGDTEGFLAQVKDIGPDNYTVTLVWPDDVSTPPGYTSADAGRHPLMRRWDHAGDMTALGGALQITEADDSSDPYVENGWITLEDGVQVRFGKDGQYRTGDYWLIPARVATGDVDWPHEQQGGQPRLDSAANPIGAAMPAHRVRHFYAPLLLSTVSADGKGQVRKDCRCGVDPLPCTNH